MTTPPPLDRLAAALAPLSVPAEWTPQLDAIRTRLQRELAGAAHARQPLVVGLIGPNNAGKSTLFTALSGSDASPASPRGGFTRTLHGAAHPHTLRGLGSPPSLGQRFLALPPGPIPHEAPAHALQLTAAPALPEGLVLIDAPDFDSVHDENHRAAQALADTADLLLVVVTRHTYANAAVHRFLHHTLGGGRPWWLVLNESPADPALRAEHVQTVAQGAGHPPDAAFFAPHDLAVAEGQAPLQPLAEDGTTPLALGPLVQATTQLRRRAHHAAALSLRDDLLALQQSLQAHHAALEALRHELQEPADTLGTHVALAALPLQPLHDALRSELDRRGGAHTWLRTPTTRLTDALVAGRTALFRAVGRAAGRPGPSDEDPLHQHEREAIQAELDHFVDRILDVASAWTTEQALRPSPGELLRQTLRTETHPDALAGLPARLEARVQADPAVSDRFRDRCQAEVALAIDARGGDAGLQWAATALSLLPAAAVATELALTGGLGTGDLAFTASMALTAPVTRMISDRLGSDLVGKIRTAWVETRGRQLAQHALQAALPQTSAVLARPPSADLAPAVAAAEAWVQETIP